MGLRLTNLTVALQEVDHLEQRSERIGKMRARHEAQIVGRGVIFRVLAMRSAPETSDRKIESRRAELPFVVAVGREIAELEGCPPRPQDVLDGPVDIGGETPAALVVDAAAVADASEHKTVLDAADFVLIARQPGDRTDGPRHEKEAVAVAMRSARQDARERRRHRDAGQVVVAHRWMANMSRDQELILDLAGEQAFAISERSVSKRGVDDHLVFALGKALELPLRQAEAPGSPCNSWCDRGSSRGGREANAGGDEARQATCAR